MFTKKQQHPVGKVDWQQESSQVPCPCPLSNATGVTRVDVHQGWAGSMLASLMGNACRWLWLWLIRKTFYRLRRRGKGEGNGWNAHREVKWCLCTVCSPWVPLGGIPRTREAMRHLHNQHLGSMLTNKSWNMHTQLLLSQHLSLSLSLPCISLFYLLQIVQGDNYENNFECGNNLVKERKGGGEGESFKTFRTTTVPTNKTHTHTLAAPNVIDRC